MRVAVIGGGAAGCFCALGAKRARPGAAVTLFEAGPKLLAKVAVTGGGRCNLTNSFRDVGRLEEAYPRGAQLMKRALNVLSPADTQRPSLKLIPASVMLFSEPVFSPMACFSSLAK